MEGRGERLFRARWVLPVAQPRIDDGWIAVRDGRITEIGQGRPPRAHEDLGDVALLPGLVNAHTHLELSFLEGCAPPGHSMPEWIRTQLLARRTAPLAGVASDAVAPALAAAMASGTVLFGDITNTNDAIPAVATAEVAAVIFHELLGFHPPDPEEQVADAWRRLDQLNPTSSVSSCTSSVVAHAPYSVAPELFASIARARRSEPLSVHVGESPEEIEFLRTGTGAFRRLLEDFGVWHDDWTPPGCGPVEYLDRCGYLQPGMLAVHATHLSDDDLARLRVAGATIVTCPRSNEWVGAGAPDVSRFYRAGVAVAIGTDSLASVGTLNMFDELAAVRRAAPGIPAARILESATLVGARALGRVSEFGSLEPGKRAALVAVTVPSGLSSDVEEYLVSGQPASHVRVIRPH